MSYTLDALAWTLIHFCWQAAAVAVVYRIASLVLARGRSEMRYALSLAALLLMVGGALGTFAWEMRSATSSPALPNIAAEMKSVALRAALQQKATPGKQVVGLVSDVSSSMNLLRWIDGLWVLGVGVLSMRSIGGWWLIQRLRATAVDEAPEALQASFARIAVALGIRRETLLRISSAVAGPITIGALRTMVLLPLSSLTLLGPEELEMVLAHELAHVRRADFLCNIAQTLVETLFFFHPAVWWIGKQIRHERELCCDDLALKICPNPVTYATALFRLEEQRARQWRLAMALNGNQSHQTLRLRIARILGEPAGQYIQALHESHGVLFHLGNSVGRVDGRRVTLRDGSIIDADFLVLGAGVRPSVALAEKAGLNIDRGVTVNEYLETGAPGVFAAGDIANELHPVIGQRVRSEHWANAQNQGPAAGEEWQHSHSQLSATTFVPRRILYELRSAREWYRERDRCVFCDILRQEIRQTKRIVDSVGDYYAFCPYASRVPYETWLIPKTHSHQFESPSPEEKRRNLATLLGRTLRRLLQISGSYHMVLHTAPNTLQTKGELSDYWATIAGDYHWHIEILPILETRSKSYSIKEVYFNGTLPEDAAERLRQFDPGK